MKKLLTVLMALVLALGMTGIALAEAEEEPVPQPAPDPDLFSGTWQADRATAEFFWEEEGYRVMIRWAGSAFDEYQWEYSCYYYPENRTAVSMPFGSCRKVTYGEDGEETASETLYDDGQATFSFDENGMLLWKDEKEDAGKDLRFEKIPEDLFSGVWMCDRASVTIDREEEGYRVLIEWADNADEENIWEYSCLYHEDDNTLVSMPFGLYRRVTYAEGGEEVSSETVYEDGQATFSLNEDGKLIWKDEKEDAGKDMLFEYIDDDDDSEG